jgi:hypothetical protein
VRIGGIGNPRSDAIASGSPECPAQGSRAGQDEDGQDRSDDGPAEEAAGLAFVVKRDIDVTCPAVDHAIEGGITLVRRRRQERRGRKMIGAPAALLQAHYAQRG